MEIVPFNTSLYRLGKLCPKQHRYEQTMQSLRRLKKGDCVCCEKERTVDWRKRNDEKIKAYRKRPDQVEAHRRRAKQRRIDQPEKVRQAYQQWAKNHTDYLYFHRHKNSVIRRLRVKEARVFYTAADVKRRFAEFAGCCAYCGNTATSIDHVLPIVKGGKDCITNIVPACISCNCSKNDQTMESWYRSRASFSEERFERIREVLAKAAFASSDLKGV